MIAPQQLHPIAVHFPIVLLLLLATYDLWLMVRGRGLQPADGSVGPSMVLAVLAGIAALVTFGLGDLAADIVMEGGVPDSLIETHEGLGTTTAILAGVWAVFRLFLWHRKWSLDGGIRAAVVAAEVGLGCLVIVTAYFGGNLVYEHGVAVLAQAGS